MSYRYIVLICCCSMALWGNRSPVFSKHEATQERMTVNLGAQKPLHVHNDRGSVHVTTANINKPHIEVHKFGPEGYTQYVTITQEAQTKEHAISAQLSEIPEDEEKPKKNVSMKDFSLDYYVTLPAQASIMVSSNDVLSVSMHHIGGHVTISGATITSHLKELKNSASIEVEKGDITINTIKGATNAVTQSGSITIQDASDDVSARAYNQLYINNIHGNANVRTQRGHLTAENVHNVLNAKTRDSMTVRQPKPSETMNLYLDAKHTVNLYLPKTTNAHIYANCGKGIVTSELPITLAPITTRLSKETWRILQKQVNGTLGNGGATIRIDASGYVRIYELES